MLQKSFFVRDTLINADLYNSLPLERQEAISNLVQEFKQIGYIDARTEIGPDQYRRMSSKQRDKLGDNMIKVFSIETKIKELLKTDEQLNKELLERQAADQAAYKQKLQYRKRDLELYCSKKINSSRSNPTKTEYQDIINKLKDL